MRRPNRRVIGARPIAMARGVLEVRQLRNDPPAMTPRLFLTIIIGFTQNIVLAVTRLAVPLVALGLGAGEVLTGVYSGLLTAVPILGMVLFGRWVDKVGTYLPSIVSSGLLVLAALAMLAVPGYVALAIAALLVGAGANFGHIAVAGAVGTSTDLRIRARNLGYVVAANSLAQFVGPSIAGYFFDLFGSRGIFSIALVSAVIGLALLPTGCHHLMKASADLRTASPGRAVDLFRIPGHRVWLLGNAMFGGTITVFPFIAALYGTSLGFSATETGTIMALLSLGSFTSRMFNPWLLSFTAPQKVMAAILPLAAFGYGLLPLVQDWTTLAILCFLLGMVLGLGLPNTLALIYHTAPEGRRTESASVALWTQNVVQLLAPLTLGIVAALLGISTMFWLVAGLLVVAAVVIGRVSRSMKEEA